MLIQKYIRDQYYLCFVRVEFFVTMYHNRLIFYIFNRKRALFYSKVLVCISESLRFFCMLSIQIEMKSMQTRQSKSVRAAMDVITKNYLQQNEWHIS